MRWRRRLLRVVSTAPTTATVVVRCARRVCSVAPRAVESASASASHLRAPSALSLPSLSQPAALQRAPWATRARPVSASSLGSALTAVAFAERNVCIIGAPGSGKSSVARELAALTGLPLIDVDDDVLERNWHCSVAEKLRQLGDDAFLQEEGRQLRALTVKGHIVSMSGSNPLEREAMAHVAANAVVVYLDCPAELILARCGAMKVERIVGQSSRSLADILRFRSAVYESSYDVRVAVYGSDSPRTVAERVLRALSQSDRFVSTRGYDRARDAAADGRAAEFVDVVRAGLAPDRGLFVSEAMQPMTEEDIARLVPLKYQEKSRRTRAHRTEPRAALRVMERLPLGSLHPSHLRELLYSAYSSFTDPAILPVTPLHGGLHLMETFHGPTASFKDLSLQLLPHLLRSAVQLSTDATATPERVGLLVATSGDTGTAAVDGFGRLPGHPVVVLYPKDGVSVVQKAQMQTAVGDVLVLGVDGDFDFCQTTVKDLFNDPDVARELSQLLPGLVLSSANSINWGRFLPQIVFTFASYTRLVELGVIGMGEEVDVCIPTGNFGNLLGAVYARRLGLPLRRLIAASNSNNVIADFVRSGTYDLRGRRFAATVSPSIDILVSSNLERFLHLLTDGDSAQIRDLFAGLAQRGQFTVSPELHRRVQAEVASGWCGEADCLATIRRVHGDTGVLIDPHTAVAVHVAAQASADASSLRAAPMLISSTAHFAKFPATMLHALTGRALDALPTDMDSLFRDLRNLPRVHPGSAMHPELAQLPRKAAVHTRTVAADKRAVLREIFAFFSDIAHREGQRPHHD